MQNPAPRFVKEHRVVADSAVETTMPGAIEADFTLATCPAIGAYFDGILTHLN